MAGKYDKFVSHPAHTRMSMKADGSVIFNGLFVGKQQLNYDFTIGHQIVTKPFKGDNPPHVHNFQEFLAWYGTNPNDPLDFGGSEVVFYLGEELEKYVITQPTIISLAGPRSLPAGDYKNRPSHYPDRERIAAAEQVPKPTREPYFEKDKGFKPMNVMNVKVTPPKSK